MSMCLPPSTVRPPPSVISVCSFTWRTYSAVRSIWSPNRHCGRSCAPTSNRTGSMSDAGQREWRFYLDDMIDFAGEVPA